MQKIISFAVQLVQYDDINRKKAFTHIPLSLTGILRSFLCASFLQKCIKIFRSVCFQWIFTLFYISISRAYGNSGNPAYEIKKRAFQIYFFRFYDKKVLRTWQKSNFLQKIYAIFFYIRMKSFQEGFYFSAGCK